MDVDELFRNMVAKGATDLFIKQGFPVYFRIRGNIEPDNDIVLDEQAVQKIFEKVAPETKQKIYYQAGEVDICYEVKGLGRFRANIYKQLGQMAMAFRYIKAKIPAFDELNLPATPLRKLASLQRGLILVTGAAGSGKSTTIAAMLDHINHTFQKHIITIEDPIEYAFEPDKCIIDQREIGYDTLSYASALKNILRQNPDIIMIGEIRDQETMETLLMAAETGHLVFSTLHTTNAISTIDRCLVFFPPHQHEYIRSQLSNLLEGVISQRLLVKSDESGLVPAVEIMVATSTIKECIQKGQMKEIVRLMKEGKEQYGSQTFNQSLMDLINKEFIAIEDAMKASDNPTELELWLRGISTEKKIRFTKR